LSEVAASPAASTASAPLPIRATPTVAPHDNISSIQVPQSDSGCFVFAPAQGVPTLVCRPLQEGWTGKVLANAPSVTLSLVALVLSILAYRYNRSKDQMARMQSVNDDYWLRKVVSPSSIEPFLSFTTGLMSTLPPVTPASSTTTEEADLEAQLLQLRSLSVAFGNLKVVSDSLAEEVRQHVEVFEDRFVRYQFARKQFRDHGAPAPSRPEVLEELAAIQHKLLLAIKSHQSALSHVPRRGGLSSLMRLCKRLLPTSPPSHRKSP